MRQANDTPPRSAILVPLIALLLSVGFAGCGGDGGGGDDGDASTDTDTDTDVDTDTDTDTDDTCADGLPATPFDETATEVAYDQTVPDFTIGTTAGDWTLSEHWNGCDNHVFVMYHPAYGVGADQLWLSSVDELVDDSADNVHYFFLTLEDGLSKEEREARVMEVGAKIDDYLASKDQATREHWADRLHYVTDDAGSIAMVQGVLDANYGEVHFTVDRRQLLREGNSVSYYSSGGWLPQLRNTRYWARYYNSQYLLDRSLEQEADEQDVLVHRVVDRTDIEGSVPFTWTLPDASTIAGYETLSIDMRVECPGAGHPYATTCGEWDTVGSLWLCPDDECTAEGRRRIVKWITPYSSPGRWVIDITPELVHLAAGDDLRFMVQHGDNDVGAYTYKYTVDFRFGKSSDGLRPFAIEPMIPRANYAFADMADAFDPFEITPPDGAQKVELYARISGHGAVSPSGCAEFCTFEHTFDVNGVDYTHEYLMENEDRCAERVEDGVTPNQGGTWHFDRSSWCPGWTIEEWREDMTDSFALDGANIVEHIPTYMGGDPPGGNMDARVELVYYH